MDFEATKAEKYVRTKCAVRCMDAPEMAERAAGWENIKRGIFKWWVGTESNRRHMPFQGIALPTELPTRETRVF